MPSTIKTRLPSCRPSRCKPNPGARVGQSLERHTRNQPPSEASRQCPSPSGPSPCWTSRFAACGHAPTAARRDASRPPCGAANRAAAPARPDTRFVLLPGCRGEGVPIDGIAAEIGAVEWLQGDIIAGLPTPDRPERQRLAGDWFESRPSSGLPLCHQHRNGRVAHSVAYEPIDRRHREGAASCRPTPSCPASTRGP